MESGVDELNISIGDVDPNYEAAIYRIPLSLAKIKIKGIGKLIEYNNEKQRIKKISLMFRSQRLPCDIVQEKTFLSWFPGGETPSLSYGFLADYDNWG